MLLIYAHTSVHVYAKQRPLRDSSFWRGLGRWVRGVTGALLPNLQRLFLPPLLSVVLSF